MPSCRFRCRRLTLEQADHQCRTTLGRPTLHFFWPLLVCHLPPRTSRRPCTIGGPILKGGMYGPSPMRKVARSDDARYPVSTTERIGKPTVWTWRPKVQVLPPAPNFI